MHALLVFHLGQVHRIRAVYVDHDLSVFFIVLDGAVPDRVDHDNILAGLELDLVVQQTEHEPVAEPCADEFTAGRHQHYVEIGWLEDLLGVLEPVFRKSIALLEH